MVSYTGIPSTVTERQISDSQDKRERIPKRILHFSDGTLEEFSSDDEDDIEPKIRKKTNRDVNAVNPANLAWIPWMFYKTSFFGYKALAVCDFFGEYLANFFGIISPKYEYEIEHYKKMIEEEKERKKQDLELGTWSEQPKPEVVTEQLKNTERPTPTKDQQWTHDINQSHQV
ncbi:hypothetical protein O3M35_000413 [Rhynocoris fuscipes]|uniref:Protein FAM177B n=1 Tax=Rhynocoris fuscipes TaxID=488301 RepID=A0AAW1DSK0_9HEMI